MPKREDVTIKYGADDSVFQKVTKRVKETGKNISGSFGKLGETIGGFFSKSLVGGITAAGTALAALGKHALNSADELVKTADKVGVTVEELQELRFAASAAGVDQRTFDTALQRFSRRIGEAAMGTGELNKEIERLGIQLRDSQGNMRPLVEILRDYANAVQAAESPQERLRLAFKAFDSEGAALVNMLSQGAAGMDEITQQSRELGEVMSTETAKAAEDLNQQLADLGERWSRWFQNIMTQMSVATARQAGFLLSIEEREAKIEENRERIAKAQEQLNKQHKLGREGTRRYIEALERENMELQEQIDLEEKRLRLKMENDEAAISLEKARQAREKTRSKSETEKEQRPADQVQILGNALQAFQRGEISATELGVIAGVQEPGTPEPRQGAFGTLSNTSAGLPSQRQAGIIQLSPDVPTFTTELEQELAGRIISVRVRPVLVDDFGGADDRLVAQEGGRD